MSSRKPQSLSSLGIDNTTSSSLSSSLPGGADKASRRVRSHRGDSSHSRSSLGSLDEIHEVEDPSLARARDRIRRTTPNTSLSASMPSLPRSKRHSNEDTPPATSVETATDVLATDEASSRRGSRRRVPRATRSNDSLGAMSASVSSFQASDPSSRIVQRSRRAPPARSKSTDDSISLIPLDTDTTTPTTIRTRTSDSATATTNDNNNPNDTNIARATTTKPTEERGRSATTKPRSSSRSRSRSKSKGARKRPNNRAAQIVASANSGTSKRDSTESNKESQSSSTVTTTSTRTRRKPGDANNSLSGLSLLDNLAPRIGPRDAKSVDVELLSPPSRSKLPQRKLDRGLGDSGISSLAAFLNNTKSPKSNKISSSRSVGAMPTTNTSMSGSSSLSSKKPLRRRLKKKDDESLASVSSKRSSSKSKSKGHSSLGSGLDLHTASNAPMESYGTNNKMRGRKTKSKASSDDSSIQEGSLHVSDSLGTSGNNNNKNGGTNKNRSSGGGSSTTNNTKPMERLNRSMGDIAFKASDLGSLLAQQKELKRRTGGGASVVSELVVEDELPPEDDIFTMYSWTTSRQVRHKVQQERKLLNSTLRQGSFQKAFELYVGHQPATT